MPQPVQRPTGATAEAGRSGAASVRSAAGGEIGLSSTLAPGFSPVDLLYAAVAGCLVLSARIAAAEMGVLDRFRDARADVSGAKADDPPRIASLSVALDVDGDFDAATRRALIARAEELCTVSNTLKRSPLFAAAAGATDP